MNRNSGPEARGVRPARPPLPLTGLKKLVVRQGKGQTPAKRRMAAVRNRTLAEAQRKVRQAQRMLADPASVSAEAQETATQAARLAKESAQVPTGRDWEESG